MLAENAPNLAGLWPSLIVFYNAANLLYMRNYAEAIRTCI